MKVAVIPARGGSKRIPGKNIRDFCGKPMIAWSIEAARASGCFDEVIVSTDDEKIAEVARQCGATVPFMRPEHLSDDYTGTLPVIRHAVEWFVGAAMSSIWLAVSMRQPLSSRPRTFRRAKGGFNLRAAASRFL